MRIARRTLFSVVPVGLLAACGDDGEDPRYTNKANELNRSRYYTGDGTDLTWKDPADRMEAPVLQGETLDGEPLDTADAAGDVIVVNYWGSWCPPCVKEAPELVAVNEHFADEPVHLIGVNSRDQLDPAKAFEKRHKVPYPSIYDPPGRTTMQFTEYGVSPNTFPVTIVIDRQGLVYSIWRGGLTRDDLIADIEEVLAE
ncbi:TlpA family protein disulfide reductase [Salininema proteolyticum]|uniref:TlpA family protein disulfide reductase n=1 Tax=Salininema proteolyticum TaxID=1607685 RepID=A0ABV8TXG0_9ACTN